MKRYYLIFCYLIIAIQLGFSQGSPDYTGGLKVKFDEDGAKYLRIISWAQVQVNYTTAAGSNTSDVGLNLRRARVLMFSQITDKFLILTHFGLNSLNGATLSPTGQGSGSQLFFHDVWAQYNISKDHSVGAGLHYFNGISRLNNQSTLNMMTLDNNRQSWATIGLSDQFARHLGIFAKGSFGKLQYRVAINDALRTGLDTRNPELGGSAVYAGNRLLDQKNTNLAFAGYFEYQIFDEESNFLPYKVGSYLGAKKVLNIGAGFFAHPNGSVVVENTIGNLEGENVSILGIDVFYEAPLGENNGAITAYGAFQLNDYGTDYLFSAYGTGNMIYGHLGYVIPSSKSTRFQPYVSFASNSYDAIDDNRNLLGVGINAYFSGHNSKLSLEYKNQSFGDSKTGLVSLQAMIYL